MSRAATRGGQKERELDTPELEALFDIVAAATRTVGGESPEPAGDVADKVISKIGQLTRKLHEALRELGYDRLLQDTANAIPDARERLVYVASMTEQAAVRALNAIEAAKPIQDRLGQDATALAEGWKKLFKGELSVDQFRVLAEGTREFLSAVPEKTAATTAQLTDIMMAQDFQDLTGQVIKRIMDMVQDIENQLLKLLLENAPPERRVAVESRGLLNGPVIRADQHGDVVTSQLQVDELLESLGF